MESQTPDQVTLGLIERAREGDERAYDDLFVRAADRIRLFIRIRLGPALKSRLDGEDILQEAYVEAHRGFDRFEYDGEGSFARWVCRIAENKIRGMADHFQAKKRKAAGQKAPLTQVLDRERAPGTGPATAFARIQTRDRLGRAMERLDDEEREAILLRHFQERTIDEVAEMMGKSATTTRRLIDGAMARLGGILRDL